MHVTVLASGVLADDQGMAGPRYGYHPTHGIKGDNLDTTHREKADVRDKPTMLAAPGAGWPGQSPRFR